MKLEEIKRVAEKYKKLFSPYCIKGKCCIGGSIRRKKAEPKDIELVAIPKKNFESFLQTQNFEYIKNGPKYKQILLPEGVKLDLFIANKDNWGNIFLIRTGNWKFSKWIMGTVAREVGLRQKDGYLWRGEQKLSCPEEEDVFKLLKMDFIKPEAREL